VQPVRKLNIINCLQISKNPSEKSRLFFLIK